MTDPSGVVTIGHDAQVKRAGRARAATHPGLTRESCHCRDLGGVAGRYFARGCESRRSLVSDPGNLESANGRRMPYDV